MLTTAPSKMTVPAVCVKKAAGTKLVLIIRNVPTPDRLASGIVPLLSKNAPAIRSSELDAMFQVVLLTMSVRFIEMMFVPAKSVKTPATVRALP